MRSDFIRSIVARIAGCDKMRHARLFHFLRISVILKATNREVRHDTHRQGRLRRAALPAVRGTVRRADRGQARAAAADHGEGRRVYVPPRLRGRGTAPAILARGGEARPRSEGRADDPQ